MIRVTQSSGLLLCAGGVLVDAAWFQKVEEKISSLETRMAVAERDISAITNTLHKIDSNTTWIVRLLIGGILMGIIAFIIKGGIA